MDAGPQTGVSRLIAVFVSPPRTDRRGLYIVALCLLSCFAFKVAAQTEIAAPNAHLGVTACAGSTCHGAASRTKRDSGVVQNEYLIWQRYDKHARAYSVLQGAPGERIAANLGVGPAEKAQICLDCHSDNVALAQRGVQFQLSDGVGCEVCHGGSEKWLGPHASGLTSHKLLVQDFGLYPTDRPVERAELCLSCHQGDDKRFISHKIMGAGHPRLSFELQTYTQTQPAHFVIDDKYRARKELAKGVQVWAVGQALALERLVTELAEPRHKGDGVFPELVFFDCQACHHTTTKLRWQRRGSTGLGPGLPHFNDANAVMLRAIALRSAPDLGRSLEASIRALHQALSEGTGDAAGIAETIAAQARKLRDRFSTYDFTRADTLAMLVSLAQISQTSDVSDYAAAEQATMAFASIIYSLNMDGALTPGQYSALRAALEKCYTATAIQDAYDPRAFAAAALSVEKVALLR
jgi:hypothetical protein